MKPAYPSETVQAPSLCWCWSATTVMKRPDKHALVIAIAITRQQARKLGDVPQLSSKSKDAVGKECGDDIPLLPSTNVQQ